MSKYYDDLAKEVHKMSQNKSLVGMLSEKDVKKDEKNIMTADVLGTVYTIHKEVDEKDFPGMKDCDGIVDWSSKNIYINKQAEGSNLKNWDMHVKSTIRHELFHAFLYESGLCASSGNCNCGWAVNEEMVDWFAIMSPKIYRCFEKLGVLD